MAEAALEQDTPMLYLDSIQKAYGKNVILDNIDLKVSEGEFVTVVGPSGCGKSTLLRLITGEELPTEGHVELRGEMITKPSKSAGIVYQQYSLFPNLTVLENVLSGYRLQSSPFTWPFERKKYLDQAYEFLERAGIADHAKKFPDELSGGQQQRVAIVRALMRTPKVLCMDEPFSALDPGTREDMQYFLLELWEEMGMTVFFVTHDLPEAIYLGTRIICVSQYYTDDRGDDFEDRGAKIVHGCQLMRSDPHAALSPEVKDTQEFRDLEKEILKAAFDPDHRQHALEFSLSHPDSFQTLTEEEANSDSVE